MFHEARVTLPRHGAIAARPASSPSRSVASAPAPPCMGAQPRRSARPRRGRRTPTTCRGPCSPSHMARSGPLAPAGPRPREHGQPGQGPPGTGAPAPAARPHRLFPTPTPTPNARSLDVDRITVAEPLAEPKPTPTQTPLPTRTPTPRRRRRFDADRRPRLRRPPDATRPQERHAAAARPFGGGRLRLPPTRLPSPGQNRSASPASSPLREEPKSRAAPGSRLETLSDRGSGPQSPQPGGTSPRRSSRWCSPPDLNDPPASLRARGVRRPR